MKRPVTLLLLVAALSAALSTLPGVAADAASSPTITLVAHDSFAVSRSVLAAFTKQTGVSCPASR